MKNRFTILMQILLAGLYCSNSAANTLSSGNILVTATRINTGGLDARGHTTVITADDIEKSTARTLPELLGRGQGHPCDGRDGGVGETAWRGQNSGAATTGTAIAIPANPDANRWRE